MADNQPQPVAKADAAVQAQPPPASSALVVLEHLPVGFSEDKLRSVINGERWKGSVLGLRMGASTGNEGGGSEGRPSMWAHVQFELKEDAEAAVKSWDKLPVEDYTISAWTVHTNPDRSVPIPRAGTGATHDGPTQANPNNTTQANTNANTGGSISSTMRYPFGPMHIGWLIAYVNSLRNPDRSITMCRILECLMHSAIATTDPYMEYAVVNFYTKFTVQAWGKAQALMQDGVAFELCRQVFEVLGLVRKYPGANPKSRQMLLSLVERLVEDINSVSNATKALSTNKNIPEIITNIRKHLVQLKDTPDAEMSLAGLINWLRYLFSCLSIHQCQVPPFPDTTPTYHCCEECECFTRTRSRFTCFVNDVEKAKIIDCLMMMAVKDADEYVGNIAEDLLHRFPSQFCARAINGIHNSTYTLFRIRLFDAIRTAKRLSTIHRGASRRHYDAIEATLLMVKEHVQDHPALRNQVPTIDNALCRIHECRDAHYALTTESMQKLYTLQFDLTQVFSALCPQTYQLCVHGDTQTILGGNAGSATAAAMNNKAGMGRGLRGITGLGLGNENSAAPPKCANTQCPGLSQELLKCSQCKVNYYCSVECQKIDWKTHRTICKELATRGKLQSPELNSYVPIKTLPADSTAELVSLKPAFLQQLAAFRAASV